MRIEVVWGSMFSGKTEELLRRLNRAAYAGRKVMLFKPGVDHRNGGDHVFSHGGVSFKATTLEQAEDILGWVEEYHPDVVGIEEGQFWQGLIPVAMKLRAMGVLVIIAGLDMDSFGQPFGDMPHLAAIADRCDKLNAVCTKCGADAYISHRRSRGSYSQVFVGGRDEYTALCHKCHQEETQS